MTALKAIFENMLQHVSALSLDHISSIEALADKLQSIATNAKPLEALRIQSHKPIPLPSLTPFVDVG